MGTFCQNSYKRPSGPPELCLVLKGGSFQTLPRTAVLQSTVRQGAAVQQLLITLGRQISAMSVNPQPNHQKIKLLHAVH